MKAITEILDKNIDIISQRISSIKEAKVKKVVYDEPPVDFIASGPQIVALMLEAKAHSNSREVRKSKGENYQPFVINSDNALVKLKSIVVEKEKKGEPFRFDFVFIDAKERHWTPMQIISDGDNTYLFLIDAYGIDRTSMFKDIIKNENIYSYSQGGIQKGGGCHIFGIQNLNTLNNMTILEKKMSLTGNYADLSPKFLKITQSLSAVPNTKKEGIISKSGKEARKTLQQSLDASSINVKTKDGVKLQNKFFDEVFYKYLLAAKEELNTLFERGGESEVLSKIQERLEPSEVRHNTYQKTQVQAMTIEDVIEQIRSKSGFEIGDVIRLVEFSKRSELLDKAGEILKDKIRMLKDEYQIIDIIRAFPKEQRGYFHDVATECLQWFDMKHAPELIMIIPAEQGKSLWSKADINAIGAGGDTLLHFAAKNNKEEVIVALLKAGADPTIKNADGKRVEELVPEFFTCDKILAIFEKSFAEEDKAATSNLIKHWGPVFILYGAARGDGDMVDQMLKKGIAIDAVNSRGITALHAVAEQGNADAANLLLEKGAKVDMKDEYGNTALLYAVSKGHAYMVKLLLEKGAKVDTVNKNGNTALHMAAENNKEEVVVALLKAGADPTEEKKEFPKYFTSEKILAIFKESILADDENSVGKLINSFPKLVNKELLSFAVNNGNNKVAPSLTKQLRSNDNLRNFEKIILDHELKESANAPGKKLYSRGDGDINYRSKVTQESQRKAKAKDSSDIPSR